MNSTASPNLRKKRLVAHPAEPITWAEVVGLVGLPMDYVDTLNQINLKLDKNLNFPVSNFLRKIVQV